MRFRRPRRGLKPRWSVIIPLLVNLVLWWGIIASVHRLLGGHPEVNQTADDGALIAANPEDR